MSQLTLPRIVFFGNGELTVLSVLIYGLLLLIVYWSPTLGASEAVCTALPRQDVSESSMGNQIGLFLLPEISRFSGALYVMLDPHNGKSYAEIWDNKVTWANPLKMRMFCGAQMTCAGSPVWHGSAPADDAWRGGLAMLPGKLCSQYRICIDFGMHEVASQIVVCHSDTAAQRNTVMASLTFSMLLAVGAIVMSLSQHWDDEREVGQKGLMLLIFSLWLELQPFWASRIVSGCCPGVFWLFLERFTPHFAPILSWLGWSILLLEVRISIGRCAPHVALPMKYFFLPLLVPAVLGLVWTAYWCDTDWWLVNVISDLHGKLADVNKNVILTDGYIMTWEAAMLLSSPIFALHTYFQWLATRRKLAAVPGSMARPQGVLVGVFLLLYGSGVIQIWFAQHPLVGSTVNFTQVSRETLNHWLARSYGFVDWDHGPLAGGQGGMLGTVLHPMRLFYLFIWGAALLFAFMPQSHPSQGHDLSKHLPLSLRAIRILTHCCLVPYRVHKYGPEVYSEDPKKRSSVGDPLNDIEADLAGRPLEVLLHLGHFSDAALDLCAAVLLWRPDGKDAQNSPTLVVTFRGTESFENWKLDFKVGRVRHDGLTRFANDDSRFHPWKIQINTGHPVEVHRGFLEGLRALRQAGLHTSIQSWVSEHGIRNIWFAGHSLGGALATLSALEYAAEAPDYPSLLQISLFTIGSPRVGNDSLALLANHTVALGKSVRLVADSDPIPRTPRTGFFSAPFKPYKHVSGMLHVSRSGRLIVSPTALELSFVLKVIGWTSPMGLIRRYFCFGVLMLDHTVGHYMKCVRLAEEAETMHGSRTTGDTIEMRNFSIPLTESQVMHIPVPSSAAVRITRRLGQLIACWMSLFFTTAATFFVMCVLIVWTMGPNWLCTEEGINASWICGWG